MTENPVEKTATKTCESCGRDFSCGAQSEKCWCFDVALREETLANLQKDFKNCLCQDCLEKENRPRIDTN